MRTKTSLVELTVLSSIGVRERTLHVKRSAIQEVSAGDVSGAVIKLSSQKHHIIVKESVRDVLALMDNAR